MGIALKNYESLTVFGSNLHDGRMHSQNLRMHIVFTNAISKSAEHLETFILSTPKIFNNIILWCAVIVLWTRHELVVKIKWMVTHR